MACVLQNTGEYRTVNVCGDVKKTTWQRFGNRFRVPQKAKPQQPHVITLFVNGAGCLSLLIFLKGCELGCIPGASIRELRMRPGKRGDFL